MTSAHAGKSKQLEDIHGRSGKAKGQRGTSVVLGVKMWMHAEVNATCNRVVWRLQLLVDVNRSRQL